jgi:hypothetical protein
MSNFVKSTEVKENKMIQQIYYGLLQACQPILRRIYYIKGLG